MADELILESSPQCTVRAVSLQGYGGEEDWSSIRVLDDGTVLVGLSSRTHSAVLVRVNADSGVVQRVLPMDQVGRLAPSERQPKIHVNPISDGKEGWWFISHGGNETHLPLHGSRIGYQGMRLWRWVEPVSEIATPSGLGTGEHHGLLYPGDGVVALAGSKKGDVLYAVTFPRSDLFCVATNKSASETMVTNLGRINGVYAPRIILMDAADRPYVLDHTSRFWTLSASGKEMVPTDCRLTEDESITGNLLAQGLITAISNDSRDTWYGTSAWGHLFRIAMTGPSQIHVTDLGAPAQSVSEFPRHVSSRRPVTIAGLAHGPDEKLYMAISGYNKSVDKQGDCHLIRCDQDGRNVQRIARLNGQIVSYICGSDGTDSQRKRLFFVASHLTEDHPCLVILEPKS